VEPFPDHQGSSVDALARPSGHRPSVQLALHLRRWIGWFGAGRLLTAAVSVLVVVAGGWWLLRTPAPPTEAGLPYAGTSTTVAASRTGPTTAGPPPTSSPAAATVHVAGAVVAPGVYVLPGGARVHAAIAAAGGATAEGDPGALNLAAPVADGERIYVPAVGETVPVPIGPPSGSTVPSGPIDLNRATLAELDSLPGIGPATAQAIIDHREGNGPFASVDDLEAVRGIGPAKLEAIRELVRV
jgi:competence protein ComEA